MSKLLTLLALVVAVGVGVAVAPRRAADVAVSDAAVQAAIDARLHELLQAQARR